MAVADNIDTMKKKQSEENNQLVQDVQLLEQEIIRLMTEHKMTLSAAESCTGGMLSSRLINVPGASVVYEAGFVTYANKAKHKLIGVKKKTLKEHGAVSKETAKEMVKGALKTADTDYAVSITGVAGPGGGTEEKPVGLVFIGCGRKHHILVKKYQFSGDRTQVREASVQHALTQLWEVLLKDLKN